MEQTETILMDPTAAMEYLGVGRNRMYCDLLKREDFPCFKMGSKYFINRVMLQKWAEKQCLQK
ncbi:MAG: helix-turn-helix domain-containing protein [Clostridiaceae bacterium]